MKGPAWCIAPGGSGAGLNLQSALHECPPRLCASARKDTDAAATAGRHLVGLSS